MQKSSIDTAITPLAPSETNLFGNSVIGETVNAETCLRHLSGVRLNAKRIVARDMFAIVPGRA